MKLITENWRKFLDEEEQLPPNDDYENSQFPWLKDISPLDRSKFDRLGSGAFREVYSPKSDSDYVVKIARINKGDTGKKMNEAEFEASKRFPNVFPKAYSHADDWSWVVTERVEVLDPESDLWDELIVVNFPAIDKYISENEFVENALLGVDIYNDQQDISSEGIFFHITQALMQGGSGDAAHYRTGWSKEMANQFIDQGTTDKEKDAIKAYQMIFDYGMENEPIFNELYRAYTDMKLEPSDWGAGNIGIDKMSNLKVADASLTF